MTNDQTVTQADKDLTDEILGCQDWNDATDYRNSGEHDRKRDRILSLVARHRTAHSGEDDDRLALAGYRAAVSFISADSWDGCSDCINILKAARAADYTHDQHNPDTVAEHLNRIRQCYSPADEPFPDHSGEGRSTFDPMQADKAVTCDMVRQTEALNNRPEIQVGRSNGAGEDIAERLKQCPRIEDARILAPGDRVAEIVVPVSLRDDILAALSAPQGEVERLHDLLRESLYHLRLDDGAKAYHEKVMLVLRAALAQPKGGE